MLDQGLKIKWELFPVTYKKGNQIITIQYGKGDGGGKTQNSLE